MSTNSKIQWCDDTWNPVSGCTRVSAGCDHCYAVKQTYRLEKMGQTAKYGGLTVLNPAGDRHFNGKVRCHDDALQIPLKRKKPTMYFVNSMGDLFHAGVPFEFIDKVYAVMNATPHTFQILTKQTARMAEYIATTNANWTTGEHGRSLPNVWLGTSCENQQAADERIPHLLNCPAAARFISAEPLLGPIDMTKWLSTGGLHWIIAGGES